jgi:maltose O-acetyltransferase
MNICKQLYKKNEMKKSEYQKMLSGELYDAGDEILMQMGIRARASMQEYNTTIFDKRKREILLRQILGSVGTNADVQTPFYIDYGCHIEVGDNFFANFNCMLLDCTYIKIGDNVFLGPNVQVYTAHHPVVAAERIKGPNRRHL